jgi:hypothetical protein
MEGTIPNISVGIISLSLWIFATLPSKSGFIDFPQLSDQNMALIRMYKVVLYANLYINSIPIPYIEY